MNEFIIELQAKLDKAKSKGNVNSDIGKIQKQLDKLKLKAELDQDTVSKLTKDIEKVINKKITISNIEINPSKIAKSAQQTGQQIGNIISEKAQKAISKASSKSIGKYFKIDSSTSDKLNSEMEKLVNKWTKSKGKLTDIKINTKTSFDEESGENITRLHQVLVTYKNELDEVIQKTIAWRQIGTTTNKNGEEEILRGFVEVAGQYSKSIDTVNTKTDNFAKKQKETIANMQNTIKQITSRAFDSNSSRPITSDDSLEKLNKQAAYVENAMYNLKHATTDTFDDAKIKVQNEISELKILEKELRNADNVSNKMKGTDLSSGLSIARNDLEKFKADAKDFPQITKTIKDLDSAISNVGDAASLNAFNDQLRVAKSELAKIKSEINTSNRNKKVGINISGLQAKIADLQRISPEIDNFKAEIKGAQVTIQSLYQDLTKINTQSDFSVVNSKWRAFTDAAKSAGIAITEVVTKTDNFEKQAYKIKKDQETNKISLKMDKTSSTYEELKNLNVLTDDLKKDFAQLKVLYEAIGKSNSDEELVNAYKKFDTQLQKVNNSLESIKLKTPSISKELSEVEKNTFKHQVEAWIRINSNAKEFHGRMQEILTQLDFVDDATVFQKLKKEFREINAEATAAGAKGKSFIDAFKSGVQSFTEWTFGSSAVMQLMNGIKNMGRAVYDVDTSMTNLYKVTDETEGKYSEFLSNSSKNAKELGRNLSSTIEQTANWAKLGFTIDESEKLAKTSSIYSNVGEVDDDTSVSDIVTTMKAFNIEAENSINIVDKLNKLGNEFSTSAKDLGEGLSNSASTMALGGNSLEKTLALLTGGSEITQEAGELGNALKIGQMRVMGMKGDLEKLGEEIDENVESISKMQTHILNLTSGKINIFDDNKNFREYYDILEDVSKIYNDLSSTERADLIETLFGKQRGNQGTALIQAFQSGQIQKALEAATHAEGSAMQEQERWMQSLEAKTKQFEASFQSLSNTLINSDLLKFFVDLGTGAVSALDGIVEKFYSISSFFTGGNSLFGTIGALSGLLMNINGIGERIMFQW